MDSGLDNGDGGATAGDGVLDAGEVDTTSYVCHGVDGFTVLTTLTTGVSASCPNGGQRLDIGLDNGDSWVADGTLQSREILRVISATAVMVQTGKTARMVRRIRWHEW